MGAISGLVGLSLASVLMAIASAGAATAAPGPAALAAYRGYFLSVLVLLGPLIVFAWRVIPLPEEVRRRIHHHHGAH